GKNIHLSSGRLHAWYPQQPQAATAWEARIDELFGLMDRELDDAVRKKYCDEMECLVAENCPKFFLVAPNAYAMAKKTVGNLWPSVLRPQLTWNVEELYLNVFAEP
ncbi:MAG: hypothetical protein L0Z55_07845, partial [Planctomycetes bacterium]|nr:hypothetical protein [Planctomycetota bacterium]